MVNITSYIAHMPSPRAPAAPRNSRQPAKRPAKKPKDQYHHGDLRQALLEAAVRTIQKQGFNALTLRAVGDELGVSRTALYRHFADKAALLTAVAAEGYRMFGLALVAGWERAGKGVAGLNAMAEAYVHFAANHPWHYRVMFGGGFELNATDAALEDAAAAAYQALLGALLELQTQGLVRRDDPQTQANFVWAVVHGIAMLAIDGMLQHRGADVDALVRYAVERLGTGIGI
jgi:AcrR family transcriptional regulator